MFDKINLTNKEIEKIVSEAPECNQKNVLLYWCVDDRTYQIVPHGSNIPVGYIALDSLKESLDGVLFAQMTPKQLAFVSRYIETDDPVLAYQQTWRCERMNYNQINNKALNLLGNPIISDSVQKGLRMEFTRAKSFLFDKVIENHELQKLLKDGKIVLKREIVFNSCYHSCIELK